MNPLPDRIVGTDEMVGVVGVKTLDALACPTDPARWPWPIVVNVDQLIPFGGVGIVGCSQLDRVDLGLRLVDSTDRFEATDRAVQATIDQPEAGRHGPTRVEQGLVGQDHRGPVIAPERHRVGTLRSAAEQLCHQFMIAFAGTIHGDGSVQAQVRAQPRPRSQ